MESDTLSDENLPGYARIHCRTERALFHAVHMRRLLDLAGQPIPRWLKDSNTFYEVHEDEMDPILELITKRQKQPKLTVMEGGNCKAPRDI